MTKKDYQKAAEIVHQVSYTYDGDPMIAKIVMESFEKLFSNDNPRFDKNRFREACKT